MASPKLKLRLVIFLCLIAFQTVNALQTDVITNLSSSRQFLSNNNDANTRETNLEENVPEGQQNKCCNKSISVAAIIISLSVSVVVAVAVAAITCDKSCWSCGTRNENDRNPDHSTSTITSNAPILSPQVPIGFPADVQMLSGEEDQQQEQALREGTDELAVLMHSDDNLPRVVQPATRNTDPCIKPVVDLLIARDGRSGLVVERGARYAHRPLTESRTGPIKADCSSFVQYTIIKGCGRLTFEEMWKEQHYLLEPDNFIRDDTSNRTTYATYTYDESQHLTQQHSTAFNNTPAGVRNRKYFFPKGYLTREQKLTRASPGKRIQAAGFKKLFENKNRMPNMTGVQQNPHALQQQVRGLNRGVVPSGQAMWIPNYFRVQKVANFKPYDILVYETDRSDTGLRNRCTVSQSGHIMIALERPVLITRNTITSSNGKKYKLWKLKIADSSSLCKYSESGIHDSRRNPENLKCMHADDDGPGIGIGWVYIYSNENDGDDNGSIAVMNTTPKKLRNVNVTPNADPHAAEISRKNMLCHKYATARFGPQ